MFLYLLLSLLFKKLFCCICWVDKYVCISLKLFAYKKEPQQLFEILSELNLFVGELINQENITDEELQYLFTISHQFSEQLKNEKPLDLSLSIKKQRLQQEPLDLSLPNKNQIWKLTTKINTSLINKKHYTNTLETHTKNLFRIF
ncbi:hypothetical protein SHM_21030 [Spiroplasma ixodetis]|uniref:Uncharacterized protein n=1 Tax=Spiroplasma ixodetis TaxID=2141 RepID=A0ABM8BX48_9MOLU|nr:hypothetical protein SHM_21030 [Spiroplasma ixodetis]